MELVGCIHGVRWRQEWRCEISKEIRSGCMHRVLPSIYMLSSEPNAAPTTSQGLILQPAAQSSFFGEVPARLARFSVEVHECGSLSAIVLLFCLGCTLKEPSSATLSNVFSCARIGVVRARCRIAGYDSYERYQADFLNLPEMDRG